MRSHKTAHVSVDRIGGTLDVDQPYGNTGDGNAARRINGMVAVTQM